MLLFCILNTPKSNDKQVSRPTAIRPLERTGGLSFFICIIVMCKLAKEYNP